MSTFLDAPSERVFTSPNMLDAPPSNILPKTSGTDDLLQNLGTLRLMSECYPHLPYAFRSPLRTGPLFSCLDHNERTVPIAGSKGRFTLCPTLLAKWSELDKFLSNVFHAFTVRCHPNAVFWPLPSDAKYSRLYPTEEEVRLAAKRALMAFHHLIVLCSWKIASHKAFSLDMAWVETLLNKGVSPSMVEMLRISPVATFSLSDPRVGTVIDVTDHACLAYARSLCTQVPVYIYWGTCTEFREQYRRPKFQHVPASVQEAHWINTQCYPDPKLLENAINLSGRPSTSITVPPGPARVAPPVIKGSGQKQGETWREFFARRARAHPTILASESRVDKQKREQRAKNAQAARAPGRKGANVFYWDEHNGFRVRTPIGYDRYNEKWEDYHGAQRRYDAFKDEWDLCTEFDADAQSECGDEDSDDDPPMVSKSPVPIASCLVPAQHSTPHGGPSVDMVVSSASGDEPMLCDPPSEPQPDLDDREQLPVSALLVNQPPLQQEIQTSANAHPASLFVGDEVPMSQASRTMHLQDVLEMWYGFTRPPSSSAIPCPNASLGSLTPDICEGNSILPGSAFLREAATAFLDNLTAMQPFDPAVCDLFNDSLVYRYANGHLTVQRQAGQHIAVDGTKTAKMFYLITPKVVASPLIVFLDDPLAVLYLIRAGLGPDPSDVAVALASRGVPVNARVLRNETLIPTFDPPFGLGYLPFDYRPHASDYAAYLQRRDDLLRRTYGRAAILKGGIIGRLARESLGDRADFLVASGPSDDAPRFGSCIQLGDARYWDDDLDCDDEEIICGVYKLSTGNFFKFYVATLC